MIYLLWSILNISLGIYFLYMVIGFIVEGKRIFNTTFKCFSIAILVVGSTQMVWGTNSGDKNSYTIFVNKQIPLVEFGTETVKIDENLICHTNLFLTYKDQEEFVLQRNNSSLIDSVSGFEWELITVDLKNTDENSNLSYSAHGLLS